MIKRDTIQRYAVTPVQDEMGGNSPVISPKEIVQANVSISSSFGEMTQYNVKQEWIIHVATNIPLDEYIHTRYKYSNRFFKLVRQIKAGNEYFSTLIEVNQEVGE